MLKRALISVVTAIIIEEKIQLLEKPQDMT
jgi:hypothetical protein